MAVLFVQHVAYETPGILGHWAEARGHSVKTILSPSIEELPPPADFGAVFILGGPMGVADASSLPWLEREIEWVRSAVHGESVPIVGVCLGAQIIAHVLGSHIHSGDGWEIGFFPVRDLRNQTEFDAFHWHQDRFDTPAGAERILSSEACPEQGFVHGGRILGLQCHPEVTPAIVDSLLSENPWLAGRDNLWIQDPDTIRRRARHFPPPSVRDWLYRELDWITFVRNNGGT